MASRAMSATAGSTDKVALVTGGDSGIGRAVAIAYAREGADVAFTYLPEEARGCRRRRCGSIRDAGRTALALPLDLRERPSCDEAVERTVAELGGLDILVNNAGFQMARDDSLEDYDDERIDRTFKTNLYALMWLCRAAVPHLRKGRGCIINNTSIQAYDPSTSLLDYAATKAAINNFTVNLAAQVGVGRHPRQRRRARSDLDAAPARHPGDGEDRAVRRRHPARPGRTARGGRAGVRVPGLAGRCVVRLRDGARSDRGKPVF